MIQEAEALAPAQGDLAEVALNARQRMRLAFLGLGLVGLLLIASILQPNRAGTGTHEQLGLPPCTFQLITGVRCPSCGMTTSWSHFMNGDLHAAWSSNAGGLCLAVMASIAAVWSLYVAVRGRYQPTLPPKIALCIAATVMLITLVDWVSRVISAFRGSA